MHTAAVRIHRALIGSCRGSAKPGTGKAAAGVSPPAGIFRVMSTPLGLPASPTLTRAAPARSAQRSPPRRGVGRPNPRHLGAGPDRVGGEEAEPGSTVATLRHAYGHPLQTRRPSSTPD